MEKFPLLLSKIEDLAEIYGVHELNDVIRIPLGDIINEFVTENFSESCDDEEFVNELEITIDTPDKELVLISTNRKALLICNLLSYKTKQSIISRAQRCVNCF